MRLALSLALGGFGFLFGGVVAAALVALLLMGVGLSGDPRGGETTFKIAWSAAVFGFGPFAAMAFSVAVGSRLRLNSVLAVLAALALYSLVVWLVWAPLSGGNDCHVGVKWPDTSVLACD